MASSGRLKGAERQMMAEVNRSLFKEFKNFKQSYYKALMRCAVNLGSPEQYYSCTG